MLLAPHSRQWFLSFLLGSPGFYLALFGLIIDDDRRINAQAEPTQKSYTALAFSPDGKELWGGFAGGIEIRSWPDGRLTDQRSIPMSQVTDLKFSSDGLRVAVAGGNPAVKGQVEIWTRGTKQKEQSWEPHKDVVYQIAWSPKGDRLVTASHDGTCQVLDSQTGKTLVRYPGHSRSVLAVTFLGNDSQIASTGIDQSIQVWDSSQGKTIRAMDNHIAPVNDLAFQPTQKQTPGILASAAEDRTIRLWQPTIGRLLRFVRLDSIPRVIRWNPEGNRIWVGCDDGSLRVLDPENLKTMGAYPGKGERITGLALSPDGKKMVIASEKGIRFQDLKE